MKPKRKTLQEIHYEAIKLLIDHLGAPDAIRFVQQFSTGQGDYTAERRAWLDGVTLDDVAKAVAGKSRRKTPTRRTRKGGDAAAP